MSAPGGARGDTKVPVYQLQVIPIKKSVIPIKKNQKPGENITAIQKLGHVGSSICVYSL